MEETCPPRLKTRPNSLAHQVIHPLLMYPKHTHTQHTHTNKTNDMKREGRQHGMVRAFPIPPPAWPTTTASRVTNRLDSRATAGIFTRVPTKPTNHSKFTSRCGRRARCTGCHDSPTCKAKDKAKGTRKSRASDLTVNHRLVAWSVGNRGRGFDFFGSSATAMLNRLDEHLDEFDDQDCDDDDDDEEFGDEEAELGLGEEEPELGLGEGELGFGGGGGDDDDDDEGEEDAMSFCDVGFVMEDEIDGEWCVVGEL